MSRVRRLALLALLSLSTASCVSGERGSFSASTFYEQQKYSNPRVLGPARGESSQVMILYFIPRGAGTSAQEALAEAKSQHKGTVFLADLTFQEFTRWSVGYSVRTTVVEATAYTADRADE